MLKKRPPRRSRNTEPKLQHWSARSVHSQWRSTCLKNATVATRKQQRALLHHQRSAACGVQRGCQMIQLPRSTFYDRAGTPSSPCLSDARLLERIGYIQDALSGDGYRRVTRALQAQGYGIHHRRGARIMRQPGLGIQSKRRFVRTTDRQHDGPVFPNLYRNRIPDRPDQIWVADMTFIRIERGVVYLAVILDACSRKVIGYALGRQIDTQLTLAALKAAGIQRRPVPGTCIHHSDRGCQEASAEYRHALHEDGLMGSMSSVANPYDNAQAESLMKTLKVEEVYLAGYESFSDVAARRPIFIEEVYNTQRLHSALGYLSPHPFEVKRARQGGQFS